MLWQRRSREWRLVDQQRVLPPPGSPRLGMKGPLTTLTTRGKATGTGTGMEKAEVEGAERTAGVTSPVGEVEPQPGGAHGAARRSPGWPSTGLLDDREWGPGPIDYGPRTPSLLDTVKYTVDSPGHSSSHILAFAHASASNLPLRKRLTHKGVPARGDSGLLDARGMQQ